MIKKEKKSPLSLFTSAGLITILKQAFRINKKPFPWTKAISAAICAGVPVYIGLLIGQLHMGLLGGVGSFTYLYTFNEPYAQRAKKIFFIALAISASVALGTIAAPHPIYVVLLVGLIGTLITFIFGVLKIPGPAAVFIVLSFIMTTGMPVDPKAAPMRSGIVLISGIFSWIVSMVGWFFNPHGPEVKAVKSAYLALADFCEAIGSENINNVRNKVVNALNQSEEILLTGYISWENSFLFNRLVLLNKLANNLFMEILELSIHKKTRLPKEFSEAIRKITMGVELGDNETIKIGQLPKSLDEKYREILQIIYDIDAVIDLPLNNIGHISIPSKPSLKMKLIMAFDRDSIVFINAVRYGVVLSIATIIAFSFNFTRSYWIPLSCAAVMLGSTIMSTFYRAIQRCIGTIIGVIIAALIFKLEPQGFIIVIINMCLTVLTELFIVKNYAIAAMFITPNALLIAEASTQIRSVSYFASARIMDIVVGSMIGLIGTYLIGHASASSRLPDLIAKLIRSQSRVIIWLTSNRKMSKSDDVKLVMEKMGIHLINFKTAYTTALGEIPNNEEMLDILWPTVFSLEHISYLLDHICTREKHLNISEEDLKQLLFVYETMALAVEQKILVKPKNIPIIDEIPQICKELNLLQEALSIKSV